MPQIILTQEQLANAGGGDRPSGNLRSKWESPLPFESHFYRR